LSHCDFCDEFSGGDHNAFASRYGRNANRDITVSDFFHVVPSLGQIVEGHLLIVPTGHSCALADLPDEQIHDLESICQQVRVSLRDVYGDCVFFEHGIRREGSGGCGIDHAHLHAVPTSAHGVLGVLLENFQGSRVYSFSDITTTVSFDSSYLFFEDAAAQRFVFEIDKLRSQYMRKLVSESIGKEVWDWRVAGHEPELVATVERLSLTLPRLFSASRG